MEITMLADVDLQRCELRSDFNLTKSQDIAVGDLNDMYPTTVIRNTY